MNRISAAVEIESMPVPTNNIQLYPEFDLKSSHPKRKNKPMGATDKQFKMIFLDKCANAEMRFNQLEKSCIRMHPRVDNNGTSRYMSTLSADLTQCHAQKEWCNQQAREQDSQSIDKSLKLGGIQEMKNDEWAHLKNSNTKKSFSDFTAIRQMAKSNKNGLQVTKTRKINNEVIKNIDDESNPSTASSSNVNQKPVGSLHSTTEYHQKKRLPQFFEQISKFSGAHEIEKAEWIPLNKETTVAADLKCDVHGETTNAKRNDLNILEVGSSLDSIPELQGRKQQDSYLIKHTLTSDGAEDMKNTKWGALNAPRRSKSSSYMKSTNTPIDGYKETKNDRSSMSSSVAHTPFWKKGLLGSFHSFKELKQKKQHSSNTLGPSQRSGGEKDMRNAEWAPFSEPNNETVRKREALQRVTRIELRETNASSTSTAGKMIKKIFNFDKKESNDNEGESNTKADWWIDIQELRNEELAGISHHSIATQTDPDLTTEPGSDLNSPLTTEERANNHSDEDYETSFITLYDDFFTRPNAASTMLRMKSKVMRQELLSKSCNDFQAVKASLREHEKHSRQSL